MYRDIQIRALAGVGGRANAIKAMCLQCSGWLRADVTDCQVRECALWHFRPYRATAPAKTSQVAESVEVAE